MARKGRIHIPGGLYHIIVRGIERRKLFKDAKDYLRFLQRFGQCLKKNKVQCYAWVLMPNHAHFLLSPAKIPLSEAMQSVLTSYALNFNRKYRRVGHVFQNRYKSILCEKESYFLTLVRYIHRNPIRAGTVKNLKELEQYRWCGHRGMVGTKKYKWHERDEVLRCFGRTRSKAIRAYVDFIRGKDESDAPMRYEGGGIRRSCKGWQKATSKLPGGERWLGDERILGASEFVEKILEEAEEEEQQQDSINKQNFTWQDLEKNICKHYGIQKEDLRKKWRVQKAKEAKAVLVYMARKHCGISGLAIARELGISGSSVCEIFWKGERLATELNVNLLTDS